MTTSEEPGADVSTPLTRRELHDRAVRGSIWTLVNITLTLPLSVVANAVIARLLGPVGYGKLAFLLAALAAAVPLTELGFGQALAQWGVAAEVKSDRATTDLLLRSRFGFALTVQLPLLLAVGAFLLADEPRWVLVVFALSVVVTLAAAGSQAALLVQNRTAAIAKITMIVGIASQFGVVAAAAATRDPSAVWAARLAISAIGACLAAGLISAHLRKMSLWPRLPRGLPPGFWRFALLAWLAGASALLVYSRSEVFVLRIYDQATELGIFAVAFGLSQQLTLPLDSLLAPLFPANTALAAGHPDHIKRAFLRSMRLFAILAGALVTLVPGIALITPLAFGEQFARSATLFVPLGIASTFQSVTSPVTLLSFARRRGGLLSAALLLALAVDMGVAFATIPVYGAWGAVGANIVGQLTAITILTRHELAAQGTRLAEMLVAARPWAFGIASMTAGLGVGAAGEEVLPPLVVAPLVVVVGLGCFAALLRTTGGVVTSDECAQLLSSLPSRIQPLGAALLWPAVRRAAPIGDAAQHDGRVGPS